MPLELDEADRAAFEARLANYGLDQSALLAEELVTVPSAVTPLTLGGAESRFQPIVLKTADFDEVNRWLGVPDVAFEAAEPPVLAPKPLRFEGMERRRREPELAPEDALERYSREDLSSEQLETIRSAARAYLFGDSRKVREFKPWIEKVFERISISVWPFLDVTVKSGSVLAFGQGPHVLVAHRLTIEEGGVVRNFGNLKVDVNLMRKTEPPTIYPLNPALLATELIRPRIA
jgi:hypothetical protein